MTRGTGSELARFLAVGVSNTLLSFSVFRLGVDLVPPFGGRAAAVQALAYGAGIAWSFTWNRAWTFRSETPVAACLTRFGTLQLALLAASAALLGIVVDGLGCPPTPAWVGVMAAVTLANFALQRRWVFST